MSKYTQKNSKHKREKKKQKQRMYFNIMTIDHKQYTNL